ncbi:MAG: ABC transporter permease subunit [Deltaproteobacteria bacterium]|jgi:NitT/TauT family transport system permease protein|nr:MAG: ABC transporter permease subunit [Deltaproteobacteria bacterium]
MRQFRFSPALPESPAFTVGDAVILLGIASMLYAGTRLAFHVPAVIAGPDISLSPLALPWYALLSVGRMAVAYCLSMLFSLFYGYAAARNRTARTVLMPLLDVLQSVPILSFLPIVLLSLSAILPQAFAAELAAIVLIFTSQAWNMTFSFYQSMTTIPTEMREAAAVFRFDPWLRFKAVELPFAAIGLLWNSMMSWSGGWFFLMAAEIFKVGSRDFRLPGLGSYLQTAADKGDTHAVILGITTLVVVIVLLDQLVWRPLIAWTDRFKVDMVEGDEPPRSWFLDLISRAWLVEQFGTRIWRPFSEWVDSGFQRRTSGVIASPELSTETGHSRLAIGILTVFLLVALYGSYRAATLLVTLPSSAWADLGKGIFATFLRVSVALAITLIWTIPVGVFIGTNRRLAAVLQPIVQVVASIPATALFPVVLLALLEVPGGLNIAAVLLMLMGTQWYLLFNVIAGASAIPQDLLYTTDLLRLSSLDRWLTLILPALFPYIITGAITASGGAWNASIVAEHVEFGGQTHTTLGAGALIASATSTGDYALLLAATLALVLTVVLINRTFWRRLYRLAEERYRME